MKKIFLLPRGLNGSLNIGLKATITVILFNVCATNAFASELLNRDIDINVFKEDIAIPMTASATQSSMDDEKLRIKGEANISNVLPVMTRQVKALILELNNDCKFQVTSSDPEIEVVDNAIHIRVTSSAEIWVCTSFVKKKLIQETGTIIAAISPEVQNGALFLNLANFEVHDLSKISSTLGIEGQLKKKFRELLNDFNHDRELSQLPPVLQEHGFTYSTALLENTYRDRQTLVMEIEGPNDALTLLKIISALITD
ncbi:MAG: hypothetical protein GKR95_20060 [Gammaproteobacteria bacterium]|nr:hypothetical protein [Gammaproteobacteria bacterium]